MKKGDRVSSIYERGRKGTIAVLPKGIDKGIVEWDDGTWWYVNTTDICLIKRGKHASAGDPDKG